MTSRPFIDANGRARLYFEGDQPDARKPRPAARLVRKPPTLVDELVDVLVLHPGGLRRWSVMRAIRKNRDRDSREVPLKFESDVEYAFRNACADWDGPKGAQAALFYRPDGRAGEVWAVDIARAKAWRGELNTADTEI